MRFIKVESSGVLTLDDIILTGGDIGTSYEAGALLVKDGQAVVLNSVMHNNRGANAGGACVCDGGMLTISSTRVFSNQAGIGGGCHVGYGSMFVSHSQVYSNQAGIGGALRNTAGQLSLESSQVFSNRSTGWGGAIEVTGDLPGTIPAALTITNSELRDNWAGGHGGGLKIGYLSTLRLVDSTLAGNQAGDKGGGIYNDNTRSELINSTIAGNLSQDSGGGIHQSSGSTLVLTNSTIAGNQAANNVAGGIANSGTLRAYNSVIADNLAASSDADCEGSAATGDNNLVEHDGCRFVGTGNIGGKDPVLGPLQDNGGSTRTMALLAGSPALNAGDNAHAGGLGSDQRGAGYPRVVGGTVDMGAFELSPCGLSISKSVSPGIAPPGAAITFTLSFSNTGPDLATGILLTDLVPFSVTVQQVLSSGVPITDTGSSPAYVWQVGTLGVGQSGLITLTAVLSEGLPDQVFTNTTVISAANAPAPVQAQVPISVSHAAGHHRSFLPWLSRVKE